MTLMVGVFIVAVSNTGVTSVLNILMNLEKCTKNEIYPLTKIDLYVIIFI